MSLKLFILLFAIGFSLRAWSFSGTDAVLDQKLEQLYQEVGTSFSSNPHFSNQANPRLYLKPNDSKPLPPEFGMPSLETFKTVMKSYCKLMESKEAGEVMNLNRYAFVDYSANALSRRFYVYDISTHSFIHNTWGTHAALSTLYRSYDLSMVDKKLKDEVLSISEINTTHYFSNRNGSNLSTLGMTVAEGAPYVSQAFPVYALRMKGVEPKLNDAIYDRAIVLHSITRPEYPFDSEHIREKQYLPSSNGCLMFAKDDFFEGVMHVNVADQIITSVLGSPILLFHPRMTSVSLNDASYQSELNTYSKLRADLILNLDEASQKYSWSKVTQAKYQAYFEARLKVEVLDLIEETYQYLKTQSQMVGVEPNSPSDCANRLKI